MLLMLDKLTMGNVGGSFVNIGVTVAGFGRVTCKLGLLFLSMNLLLVFESGRLRAVELPAKDNFVQMYT